MDRCWETPPQTTKTSAIRGDMSQKGELHNFTDDHKCKNQGSQISITSWESGDNVDGRGDNLGDIKG